MIRLSVGWSRHPAIVLVRELVKMIWSASPSRLISAPFQHRETLPDRAAGATEPNPVRQSPDPEPRSAE
jgi:hypothetical protein